MIILPIRTGTLKRGDDIASILRQSADIKSGDILVISSKAIATVEGAHINLSSISPSDEAKDLAEKTVRSAAFTQAVIDETKRLNGTIIGHAPQTLLTDVRPDGLSTGTILTANAGLDESNVEDGYAIGWPHDPVQSLMKICAQLKAESQQLAAIVSDSNCRPRRLGVTAFALVTAGIDPLRSEIGNNDLFGHSMRVTVESTADQLATAANFLMGNAAQSTPAAIIRDHNLPLTDYCGWVEGIEPEEDLFGSMF